MTAFPKKPEAGKLLKTAVAEPYKRTPAEEGALVRYGKRSAKRPPARIKVSKGTKGISSTGTDHLDPVTGTINLLDALGTANLSFMEGLLKQITNVASQGPEPDESNINFVLSVVSGIEPRDQLEAMLAAQMAAVHLATMTFARRLAHVDNIAQQDAAEKAFNKLARTFTTQVEALKRYRSDGQQTLRVERVTVEAGGQAVVGNVSASLGGGGPPAGTQRQPHAKAISHAPVAPLWGANQDHEPEPVPIAGNAERPVSDARGPVARRAAR